MLIKSLSLLCCPQRSTSQTLCSGELFIAHTVLAKKEDLLTGTLICKKCEHTYPILAGVAVLVEDVENYLLSHVKGISAVVEDSEIPEIYQESFKAAKAEIEMEHIEEDLESSRINALYFMNHYMSVKKSPAGTWWRPKSGSFSKEIDQLVRKYWDHGPFSVISKWTRPLKNQDIIELGCGVGGLAQYFKKSSRAYLGIDSSFASIALARHINLGTPYSQKIKFPQDLFQGPLTGDTKLPKLSYKNQTVDFVVGELQNLPVNRDQFDLSIALNAIDMLEEPGGLPKMQFSHLREGGIAIQSCPYIWHEFVATQLRKVLPKEIKSSSQAVEYLYQKAGFKIFKKSEHHPWLFFKHFRQIELYSVHLFSARKTSSKKGQV